MRGASHRLEGLCGLNLLLIESLSVFFGLLQAGFDLVVLHFLDRGFTLFLLGHLLEHSLDVILGLVDKALDDLLFLAGTEIHLLEALIQTRESALESLLTSFDSFVQFVGLALGLFNLLLQGLGSQLVGCLKLVLKLGLNLIACLLSVLVEIDEALFGERTSTFLLDLLVTELLGLCVLHLNLLESGRIGSLTFSSESLGKLWRRDTLLDWNVENDSLVRLHDWIFLLNYKVTRLIVYKYV